MLRVITASLTLVALAAMAFAADSTDALSLGEEVAPFYVTDVTGPAAGNPPLCYRCRFGDRPVVAVFTRKVTSDVQALIKEIDTTVGKNSGKDMAGFVVMLTDDPAASQGELKKVATDAGLKNVPLTTFEDVNGPRSYKLDKSADVQVMMWVGGKLVVNDTFAADKLNQQTVAGVVGNTAKILN